MSLKARPDSRYQSDSVTATRAEAIAFPVRIFVRKQTYAAALSSAQAVLAELEKEAAELRIGTVTAETEMIAFGYDPDLKTCSGADLSCVLVLAMEAAASLWARSEVMVRMLDLVQKFVDQSRQSKEIQVQTGQAQNRPKAPSAPLPPEGGGVVKSSAAGEQNGGRELKSGGRA